MKKKNNNIKKMNKFANVLSVNQCESDEAIKQTKKMSSLVNELDNNSDEQGARLDNLIDFLNSTDLENFSDDIHLDTYSPSDKSKKSIPNDNISLNPLNYMHINNNLTDLIKESNNYSKKNNLNLNNPYLSGLSETEINQISLKLSEKYELSNLDKYDYAFAGVVGIIGGLIDVFFVKSITDGNNPKTSAQQGIINKNVDNLTDKFVKKYASWESGKKMNSKSQAIRWLENNHKVSYDASNNSKIHGTVDLMNPSNHHLFSLSHDPGILGLIFSIIDQLDGKSSFFSDGKLVRLVTDSVESNHVSDLTGIKKIIAAIINWFGHICSDISGTSNSIGRGSGLPAPFYNLIQKLHFGNIKINGEGKDFAQVSEWLFKQGLDFRALTAQAIPIIIIETFVRLYWIYKNHFYYGKSWKESIPIANQFDLQKLLLASIATFETTDIVDALEKGSLTPHALLFINYDGIIDFSFRSLQVFRSSKKKEKNLITLDYDLQDEFNRIYQKI